jgi:hypothetical protein
MRSLLNNPGHWRARAEETRRMAEGISDLMAKESLLRVAEEYEQLALHAESRLSDCRSLQASSDP